MQVNASIDESDIGRIATGQTVVVPRRRISGRDLHGKVSQVRLEPVVAQNVVSYVTVIDVPNKEHEAEAGHDGERDRSRSPGRTTCCACRMRRSGSGRRPMARRVSPGNGTRVR